MKEAANRMGFGETVAVEGPGSDALKKRAASKFETSLLSNFQTPALINLCAERITVDAREKD
jgi:hypothetical protein